MVFTALPDDHADRVLASLQFFRDTRAKEQRGIKVPLHIFALPCDQVV